MNSNSPIGTMREATKSQQVINSQTPAKRKGYKGKSPTKLSANQVEKVEKKQ